MSDTAKQKSKTTQQRSKKLSKEKRLLSLAAAAAAAARPLSGEQASAPCCPDLALGKLAEGLGLHDDGHRGELSLAQDLEEALRAIAAFPQEGHKEIGGGGDGRTKYETMLATNR